MAGTEKDWAVLTWEQKRERRLKAWLEAPGVQFASPEAEAGYRARTGRLIDVIMLRKPDRVPVTPALGEFVATYAGYTQKDITYDADKIIDAATRCTLELDFDAKTPAAAPTGRVWEILENIQRNWPGRGLPDDGSPQFVEGEYMKADEYDDFILDETDFRWRSYLPRTWGIAAPFRKIDISANNVASFGLPEVQDALRKLMEAGAEAQRWEGKIAAANRRLTDLGYPDLRASALATAPFDHIGDNLRGQRGVSLDMYRQPAKLLDAIEAVTRRRVRRIRQASRVPTLGGSPVVGFPLHKGADGFMSDEQFRTFYWPSLKKIVLAYIEEGFVPELRTQGSYNSRLEVITELPKGTVIWHFYMSDIDRAKRALAGTQCFVGSVPQSLLSTGTPRDVDGYARGLIERVGADGGFILCSPGAMGKEARTDCVKAMVAAAKKYGVYR
jgi:hypothetical protein